MVCCYEAGRDGFWLHRLLLDQGVQYQVVDSSSIEVNRSSIRAKSDSLDAVKLVRSSRDTILNDPIDARLMDRPADQRR